MKKRLAAALAAAFVLPLTMATPAEAHIETCTLAAYAPSLVAPHTLRAKARWYCTPPTHHDFNHVDLRVEYKIVHHFWPDGWAAIPPNNSFNTTHMEGSMYDVVRCANGEKTYRTKFFFDMYGQQGVRHHSKTSGETTKKCG